ncbi:MAG: SRPBCC family protein [Actinobacteria bacterium]|nr:SRPBCC family protein [Actinomycetota bacterium]
MSATRTTYRFDNLWHLRAPREQVYAALADVEGYQRWWPQVREIHRINAERGRVRIRSLLPYTLDLVLVRTVQDEARGVLRVDVDGDLRGWCAWQFSSEGAGTRAQFSQEVEVTALVLRRMPFAIRPLLRGNHAHMMRSGEHGLRNYLASSLP